MEGGGGVKGRESWRSQDRPGEVNIVIYKDCVRKSLVEAKSLPILIPEHNLFRQLALSGIINVLLLRFVHL